jgi:hypothetical protein
VADLNKELVQSLVEGIRRLIVTDQAFRQMQLPATGQTAGQQTAYSGSSGIKDDQRSVTGYDLASGQTMVSFTLDASEMDGDDVFSM